MEVPYIPTLKLKVVCVLSDIYDSPTIDSIHNELLGVTLPCIIDVQHTVPHSVQEALGLCQTGTNEDGRDLT